MASYDNAATLSNSIELLKDFYLPAIQDQLNKDNILSDKIDTNEIDVSGTIAKIECHIGRNTGVGAREDFADLPNPGRQRFKQMDVPMKRLYGTVAFSGPTIAATRDERGAYAKIIDTEIMGVTNDMQKEVNRQLWGCGYGVLGRWYSGTGTSVTLQKRYLGNAHGGNGFGSTFGMKYLEEVPSGVWNVAASTTGAITIMTLDTTDLAPTAFTEGTHTDNITVTDTGTPGAGTYIVRPGSSKTITSGSTAGAARLEMMGLRGIVTDEDLDEVAIFNGGSGQGISPNDPLQGISVASNPWWRSSVDTSTGTRYGGQRSLTMNLMQKMFDKIEAKAGKEVGPDLILTTNAIRREYIALALADRRVVNDMSLDGGWKGISYNGVLLYTDNDAIDGEMYFLTTKDLQIYRMADYDWMNRDGSILSRVSGKDAYEAVLFRYAELGCNRRHTQGVIADLSYTA